MIGGPSVVWVRLLDNPPFLWGAEEDFPTELDAWDWVRLANHNEAKKRVDDQDHDRRPEPLKERVVLPAGQAP